MGSRLRQLRLPIFAAGLAVVACAAMLVSSALGSTFPGTNGKLVYGEYSHSVSKLYTANADGTGQNNITTPAAKQQGDGQPRFSADGTKVVFIRNPEQFGYDKTQIWVANADGSLPHKISISGLPKNTSPRAATFTPDGQTIVFELDNISAPIGIWSVPVAGSDRTATQLTNGNDYQPTVSPDGTEIAFMRGFTVMIANADGSDPQELYTAPDSAGSVDEPEFSPDGSTIAFMQMTSGNWDIFTIAADGSDSGTPTNLTNGTTFSSLDPAYSPDGTQIAFTRVNNSTYKDSIAVMPATGGAPTVVVTAPRGGSVYEPDWGVETPAIPDHPPVVVRVSPRSGAKRVAHKPTVTATWNEALSAKTLVLTDSHGHRVTGTTTCSAGCSIVTFTPAAPLKAQTTYHATATGKSAAGHARKRWSFETK